MREEQRQGQLTLQPSLSSAGTVQLDAASVAALGSTAAGAAAGGATTAAADSSSGGAALLVPSAAAAAAGNCRWLMTSCGWP